MTTIEALRTAIEKRNQELVHSTLARLTNMELKRTEQSVRESLLPSLPNELFWEAMLALVKFRRQAFISGIMAVETLAKNGTLDFECEEAIALSEYMHTCCPESIDKLVSMALPKMQTEMQMDGLFQCFRVDNPRTRIALLLKSESPLAYYVLFKSLKHIPDQKDIVRKCCIYIMKRNNDMAFNMASIMRTYFGIDDLKSHLSLRIEPYELNLIDRSYETFFDFLNGKRPKVK